MQLSTVAAGGSHSMALVEGKAAQCMGPITPCVWWAAPPPRACTRPSSRRSACATPHLRPSHMYRMRASVGHGIGGVSRVGMPGQVGSCGGVVCMTGLVCMALEVRMAYVAGMAGVGVGGQRRRAAGGWRETVRGGPEHTDHGAGTCTCGVWQGCMCVCAVVCVRAGRITRARGAR